MASSTEFADFVVESLQPLGPVVARRMFGGFGIYLDGVMFALIAYDTLYFKVDDGNRPAYEDAGLPHFVYTDRKTDPHALSRGRARASTTPRSCATGRARPTPPPCGPGSPSAAEPSPAPREVGDAQRCPFLR